jgi:hypothetical protein
LEFCTVARHGQRAHGHAAQAFAKLLWPKRALRGAAFEAPLTIQLLAFLPPI